MINYYWYWYLFQSVHYHSKWTLSPTKISNVFTEQSLTEQLARLNRIRIIISWCNFYIILTLPFPSLSVSLWFQALTNHTSDKRETHTEEKQAKSKQAKRKVHTAPPSSLSTINLTLSRAGKEAQMKILCSGQQLIQSPHSVKSFETMAQL